MKIIVAGAGRIGYSIASELSKEKHDITVIERDVSVCQEIDDTLDVFTLNGNAADCDILEEAGAPTADLLIAVTQADEANLMICLTAKKLGVKHTIARVRNKEYYKQISIFKNEFGLSMTINPEEATAGEISRILRFPSALKVEPFAKGTAESIEIRIGTDSPLSDLKIADFHGKFSDRVLICAVSRKNEVFIPRGDFVLRAGDRLNIVGAYKEIVSFLKKVTGGISSVKTVIVLGGGTVSRYLLSQLDGSGIAIKVIEKDEEACARISSEFPKAGLVFADGRKSNILTEEGIESADAFVALTGDDDDNVITSMYAMSLGIKKVITKIKEGHIIRMLEAGNLDSIVQPSGIATQHVVKYVRSMQNAYSSSIDALYYTFDGRVEILEFRIKGSPDYINIPIKYLHISRDALIASIIHDGKCIIPSGDDVISSGDSVIVATVRSGVFRPEDVLEA